MLKKNIFLVPVFFYLCVSVSFSQARLILNNSSFIVIDNGAKIVVENPNPNAITTMGTVKGIVSESENDEVIWKIGSSLGNFTVPWITNPFGTSTPIPLTVQITSAGNALGQIDFATYETSTDFNTPYPIGVSNLNIGAADASLYVVDRFWKIKSDSYSSKPNVNLIFTYDDANNEIGGANTIVESSLKAQRYDGVSWGNMAFGSANSATNTVGAVISASNFFNTWILESSLIPLAVDYSSISMYSDNCEVFISVNDFVSEDNSVIEIYNSTNGIDWEKIGAFNQCNALACKYVDSRLISGLSYYKFVEIDESGFERLLEIKSINNVCDLNVTIYPNPSSGIFNITNCADSNLEIVDIYGRSLLFKTLLTDNEVVDLSAYETGDYLFKLTDKQNTIKIFKVIKN